ncbi:hypothetical protein JS530_05870 [Bifidobacterium sp. LC6]|uniref:Alpha/beta hydrolase domain-containing protein n=1 Tax=Bifidobacterium colobi TaxID=2809026 RepID=A0ABS5UXL2_9BIFI|nr:alpha/beta hydrolase domain-containing protein [Bifidobacterium colobi]MBT1175033.1 hypothetical protein [Bifidobacterium colobi]
MTDIHITDISPIPVTEDSRPFASAAQCCDFDRNGYIESEYYMSGTANVYETHADGTIGVRTPNAPYTNRFIVRAPRDTRSFSGNVVVEIINPSAFIDLERMWVLGHTEMIRRGDIYVGITSKPNTIAKLLEFDHDRYSSMNWANPTPNTPFGFTDEQLAAMNGRIMPDIDISYEPGLFWDMLTDLALLLRSNDAKNPLHDYHPKHIALAGWSQSAAYLIRYVNDFTYRRATDHDVFDGFIAAGPPRFLPTPVNQYEVLSTLTDLGISKIRTVRNPCIIMQTESENSSLGAHDVPRPDGDEPEFMCRHYDITGASHDTRYTLTDYYQDNPGLKRVNALFGYDGRFNKEPNNYPSQFLVAAAIRNLFRWIETGVAPEPSEPIHTNANGTNVRDAFGNSIGGLRTCLLDYPTGTYYSYSDINPKSEGMYGKGIDGLYGHEEPFPASMLIHLYGTLKHYEELCKRHTFRQVTHGFICQEDADALVRFAVSKAEERGLR